MTKISRAAETGDHGGFARALQAAIEASGLGLEQIQRRLARQGHDVSLASLSYWRYGRSRPSKQSSLDAVAALEPILGVPAGSLAGLLAGTPGGGAEPTVPDLAEPIIAGLEPRHLPSAIADLLENVRERVELVSDHQRVVLDAAQRCTTASTRRVYRALVDGVDRLLVATSLPDGVPSEPGLVALGRGRPGAGAVLGDHGVVLTELLLDRTLRRGEAVIVELGLDRSPGVATGTPRELCSARALRELVVEVQFDPHATPRRCEWYQGGPDAAAKSVTALFCDANAALLVLRHDVRTAHHGVRWDWD